MLALQALRMLSTDWILGLLAILIVLLLRKSRFAPAAVVLVLLGVGIMFFQGQFQSLQAPRFSWPRPGLFAWSEVWQTMLLAGFSQLPLTATNAVIATAVLIREYWPDRPVSEKRLSLNMGIINLVSPLLGGMPMCHGAGGLAGQYYFGARTGGANILEGLIELSLGFFLAGSIAALFAAFPVAIVGAMMLLVGFELTRFARDVRWGWPVLPLIATLAVSLWLNMACGFLAGLGVHYGLAWFRLRLNRPSL